VLAIVEAFNTLAAFTEFTSPAFSRETLRGNHTLLVAQKLQEAKKAG
jgi:hypothetical protein